jgi:hypothetical protein
MEWRELLIRKKNNFILSEVDRITGGGGVFPPLLVLCVNTVSDLVVL